MYPKRANIPLQGLDSCTLKVGAISGLAVKLEPYIGTISPVIDYMVSKRQPGKADHLTLASGDSEHA